MTSKELAEHIRIAQFARRKASIVGLGIIGKEYIKALRWLGVPIIQECSAKSGGFESMRSAEPGEAVIIATPIHLLVPAARHCAQLGYKRMLIEKPVSLYSDEIDRLSVEFAKAGTEAFAAYNRIAYPSYQELKARVIADGGITSSNYTFTEFTKKLHPEKYGMSVMQRWGIANSLHVIGMAHALIGLPEILHFSPPTMDDKSTFVWKAPGVRGNWTSYSLGPSLAWHDNSRFIGCGVSEHDIPFSYHADWNSSSRWSIEVHTCKASYRLCPLERLYMKTDGLAEWSEIELTTATQGYISFVSAEAPEIKTGIVEQVAAFLDPELATTLPLMTLGEAAKLTRFAEKIFHYS